MRLVESRFLRGPNIHRMAPCFVAVVDLEGPWPVDLGELPDQAILLRALLPGGWTPVVEDAAEGARLLARLMFAVQAWAGSPVTTCDAVSASSKATRRYRLVCSYQQEAVAEEALRISVALVTALLERQALDLEARLVSLRALAEAPSQGPAAQALPQSAHARVPDGRIPVVAITGTNGKTTTTQLIAHVLRACGVRTGTTTTQGIYIDGQCVQTGDCSGYWSARKVLADATVQVATLETARGGILKRGLAFDHCDVGVVLNVSSDHLGLDGVETLQDLAHVKGLVARSARVAAVLNADDAWCVAMRQTLAPECRPVFFTLDPRSPVFLEHLRAGGAGACLDDEGWLVWCSAGERVDVVKAAELPFTWRGRARYNTANALAALAALRSMGYATAAIARALTSFVSDPKGNPLRGNEFEVDGVKLIVDYAHNVVAYRALCQAARSMLDGDARLVGVVTSPGDRRPQDLYETGQVCGQGFDELVVYEHDLRGRGAGAITREILRGARSAAPAQPQHGEPRIRHALGRGLTAARPGDVLVFACAGSFADLVEGVRLKSPAAADRIAHAVSR